MADRPNFLVICTDQQSAGAMSCAGNEFIETPAIDRLAKQGVQFENAYCTFPVCTPSRASIVSGRMPHGIGVTKNNSAIDEEYRDTELGNLFSRAGYECVYAGKWHVPEPNLPRDNDHGFERICRFNDDIVAGACQEFLRRDREDPFLLVASFSNPHDICEWGRDQHLPWGSVPEVSLKECPPLPANIAPPPFEPECIELLKEGTPLWNGAMQNASDADWRRYRHAYFRLVEKIDDHIGIILDELEATGLAEDTVVLFTSDHGDGHGAHRCNQKTLLYEEMVNIPFILSDPKSRNAGVVREELVSNGLDLLPTLCDYADIDPPADLLGRSVRPLVADQSVNWRDFLFAQTEFDIPHGNQSYGIQGRMVRSKRYKYVVYSRGHDREQLFDIKNDPGEMVDLTENALYTEALDTHRERLLEWCLEQRDLFDEHGRRSGIPAVPGFEFSEIYERIGVDPATTDLDTNEKRDG